MVRFSNGLIGTLNILTLLLSIPILGGGIWLSAKSASVCEHFLSKPLIVLGVFLLVASVAGLAGSCCRVTWLLWFYLLAVFLLILLVLCLTIFAFVVTNPGAGKAVSGKGFKEYKLGDYSNWLQRRVDNPANWEKIRGCLSEGFACRNLQWENHTRAEFDNVNLSPIESGCCKPPTSCNFTYRSDTLWDKPSGFDAGIDDCNRWSNDQSKLCFDCGSCKAGFLANIKHDWKKVVIVNIVVLIFLIIVYIVGCCAFRNNREGTSYRMKGYP